jgi:O-antigen/teichoic acid export membrane protein
MPLAVTRAEDVRRQRIIRTAWSGALARAVAFLPTLGIAPLAVAHLGAERFGVLMTVLSLMAFLSLADLGIGGSLVTGVSRALGAGDLRKIASLQANGMAAICVIAIVLATIGAGLAFSDVGGFVFPHSSGSVRGEATRALSAFALVFAFTLPLTLVAKVQLGLQRGHLANHWQTAGGLINFAGGALACGLDATVPWIVLGLLSGTLLCGLANTIVHLRDRSPTRPTLSDVRRTVLVQLLKDSLYYLSLQIIFLITYAVDTLIVARQLGAEVASTYALAERLFSVVAVAVSVVTAPLWAAYGEAIGSNDSGWARQCLRTSLRRILLVGGTLSALLLAVFVPVVGLLGSGLLLAPLGVAAAMAAWRIVEALGSMLSVYLFATQAVGFVVVSGAFTAAISLTLKTAYVKELGPAALPLITLTCFVLFSLLPCWLHIRRSHAMQRAALEG